MTTQIYRFGTSGYRTADSATGFTEAIVQQITHAMADYWLSQQPVIRAVIVSHDSRPISRQRSPQVAQWLATRGFDVYLTTADMPIPMVAFAAQSPQACGLPTVCGAVYVGASHNPPQHAGINMLSAEGAVMASAETAKVEAFQAAPLSHDADVKPGAIHAFDPLDGYAKHLTNTLRFDWAAIAQAGLTLFYDPLYATGRRVFPHLCQQAGIPLTVIHGEDTPPANWDGEPNPTETHLALLAQQVRQSATPAIGLANDGDADRFGVIDEQGRFVPTNDVLLMALEALTTHKLPKQPYILVRSQASSHALDALAQRYGWSVVETPVGYKYVAETILDHHKPGKTPVALGAEASGGLSILGHIPEKDGIVANLLIMELAAWTGEPLSQIIARIRRQLPLAYCFKEFAVKTDAGDALLNQLLTLAKTPDGKLGEFTIDTVQTRQGADALVSGFGTRDGVKLRFTDGSWLLFRKSGTEPLVRFVLETVAPDAAQASARWDALKQALSQFCAQAVGLVL